MITIKVEDTIDTSFSGYKQVVGFYHNASVYTNETISIDFYNLDWIDANMCALFEAVLHKLNKENNLQFSTDYEFLNKKFDVLFRNGFLSYGNITPDKWGSTMPTMSFEKDDKTGFVNYIENKLLRHRGMPALSGDFKEQITDDLIEIFCNVNFHANTTEPFFVGGQYYHRKRVLKFTMVDLGEGFLPKIMIATNNKIDNSLNAIKWAVNGNSTKPALEDVPGGLGISRIHKYCLKNAGTLQIVTGNGFWGTDLANTIFSEGRILPNPFIGTTINLFFRYSG